jgi:nicotinamidase/pyrazinamidase
MRVVEYGPQTALIVVDVQNDFADRKGSLYVAGGEAIIEALNGEIARATEAGAFVVYTQDWHPAVTPHFAKDGGVWPDHCVQDSWGAAFHPDLNVVGPVVRKGTGGEDGYSGFMMRDPVSGEAKVTELDGLLGQHSVERVIIAGLATDYCVKDTVLDARTLGYDAIVLIQLVRAVDIHPGDGSRAVTAMSAAGASFA